MIDAGARVVPSRLARGASLWRRDRPLVWAHRGASAHATENTIAAFELARPHGADGIELDVLCCGSGEVVVFHDETLARLAERPERVEATPWAILRDVELRGGHRIPLLADALAAAGELRVNVELKSFRPGRRGPLPAAAARVIVAARAAARVVVSSFDPVALWQLHQVAPHLPLGFLLDDHGAPPWPPGPLPASSIHPHHARCTPGAVQRWHARGFAVHTWTVDDPVRLRALAAAGVDGVFANDPRAARAALTP